MTSLLQCIRHKYCIPGRECPTALACDHKIRKPALQVRRLPVTAAAVASSSIAVDGGNLEILSSGSEKVSDAPPILFLHGAAHGAWCWAERLMPDLEQAGLKTYAMSFRGHGQSFRPSSDQGGAAGTLLSHAEDIASVIRELPATPVLAGHSFGGLILQRYLVAHRDDPERFPAVAGVIIMSSNPPQGTDFSRYMANAPIQSIKMTWSFISKNYLTSLPALRHLFFSPGTPDGDLEEWQRLLNEQSTPLKLLDLTKLRKEELPIAALSAAEVPPALVIGAAADPIVDRQDCEALAASLHTEQLLWLEGGHDVMLDVCWPQVSAAVADFARGIAA